MIELSDNPARAIRVHLGLTQAGLAARLGLSANAVYRLERRSRLPVLHYLALRQLRHDLRQPAPLAAPPPPS